MDALPTHFSFRDGELTISSPSRSYRIRGWPEPRALEKLGDSVWKTCQPEFRLVKPGREVSTSATRIVDYSRDNSDGESAQIPDAFAEKRRAFEGFRSQLPTSVVRSVENFQSHQWNLLDLLSKEETSQDLIKSNPVLCWCLANNDQFRRPYGLASPAEYARVYISKKQRAIMGWLGFPASESAVKVMRKIIPEAITTFDAKQLCRVLTEASAARLLAHIPAINSGVLGLCRNPKLLPLVTPQLLAEVGNADEERIHQPTADRLLDAKYLLMTSRIFWRPSHFDSIGSVCEFHARVLAEVRRRSEAAERRSRTRPTKPRKPRPREFPLPPIPGTKDIIPLTTRKALRAEGAEQKNCVGSYARKVKSGAVYIYKVLNPERATLSITKGPDGFWRRAELECAANRPASWSTKAKVDQWLSAHSLSV